jgi:ATP-binding cassette subfamily B protein
MSSSEGMPPAFSSMIRVLKLGYRAEPFLLVWSFSLTLVAAVPDALLALWLKWLGEGVMGSGRERLVLAMVFLGLTPPATWLLRTWSTRVLRRFRDRVTVELESHVARLQASVATIAHQERPEYLDRLSVLRNQIFVLDHMYMSLFTTCGWLLRLALTVALLMTIHPAFALLAACALPAVLASAWRPGVERGIEERTSEAGRLARHLFTVATSAPPGKEVRVTGIGEKLVSMRREAFTRSYLPVAEARWGSALWHALAWAVFGGAYVLAVAYASLGLRAPVGSVLLVLAAGSRLSGYVAATVGEVGFLRGIWLDGSRRLAWLEDYARSLSATADAPSPTGLKEGIRLEGVSFAYPGTDRLVLSEVDLSLPKGSVIAIVGENGAGKSTLVKLLGKLYEPTAGRILVDGVPLGRVEAGDWRGHLSGAFQDFFRFEFVARDSVGLGDLGRLGDVGAVSKAVDRAGAGDLVAGLAQGLETQLGPTWPNGVEVSFGQWQKLALARGFMREEPLLLLLDEPTAALDAETEHALFERFATAARGSSPSGRITILVSHRFSTVRMADLIVVLQGSRIAEVGTHEALMARDGPYSELYRIQAAAYS